MATRRTTPRDWVPIILAVGLSTGANLLIIGVFVSAYFRVVAGQDGTISENATQILTGWGGGMVGILGAMFGYRSAMQHNEDKEPPQSLPPSDDT